MVRMEGGDLRVCGASGHLEGLIARTGLSRVLRLYPTQGEAMAALHVREAAPALSQAV
jgi:hypothetical protein